jgi:hypothetical protein
MAPGNVDAKNYLGLPSSNSFGFQSNQGTVYYGSQQSPKMATYTADDVVGCGLIRTTNIAFFTKNGQKVGQISIQEFSDELYPAVTIYAMKMLQTGVAVSVNLGQQPFKFDVRGYAQVKNQ